MCEFKGGFVENGYISFYEDNTKILHTIDNFFRSWIINSGGVEYHIPALIDKKVLDKCGYFNSFPQHLTVAAYIKPEYHEKVSVEGEVSKEYVNIGGKYFTPAACLHIYPMLEGKNIDDGKAITTLARVYRYEEGNFNNVTRMWDFTVREFVFAGTEEYVLSKIEETKKWALNLVQGLGIDAKLIEAADHFYPTKKNMVKTRLQKANSLKFELIVPIKGHDTAISSFNFHGMHFSEPFAFDNGGRIVTGCVGFGLERWVAALNEYNVTPEKLIECIGESAI